MIKCWEITLCPPPPSFLGHATALIYIHTYIHRERPRDRTVGTTFGVGGGGEPNDRNITGDKPNKTLTIWSPPPKLLAYKEGNVLFNDALNTFYLPLYDVRHMVKYHSDSERGNPLPPHGLLFPISSKGSFICIIPQTGCHIPRPLLHQSWSTGWNVK